jgi:hypothetical protein
VRTIRVSDQTVVELLNRFGVDGCELACMQEHREGESGPHVGSSQVGDHAMQLIRSLKRFWNSNIKPRRGAGGPTLPGRFGRGHTSASENLHMFESPGRDQHF